MKNMTYIMIFLLRFYLTKNVQGEFYQVGFGSGSEFFWRRNPHRIFPEGRVRILILIRLDQELGNSNRIHNPA